MESATMNEEMGKMIFTILHVGYMVDKATRNALSVEFTDADEYKNKINAYAKLLDSTRISHRPDKPTICYVDVNTKLPNSPLTIPRPMIADPNQSKKSGEYSNVIAKMEKKLSAEMRNVEHKNKIIEKIKDAYKNYDATTAKTRGCYVGAQLTTSEFRIMGASLLGWRETKINITDAVKNDLINLYYNFMYTSLLCEEAISALTKKIGANNKVYNLQIKRGNDGIDHQASPLLSLAEVEQKLAEKYVPASVHGSTRTMPASIINGKIETKGDFFVEMAVTSDTTKVASCFPCAAIMAANGLTTNSMHLESCECWVTGNDKNMRFNLSKKLGSWWEAGINKITESTEDAEVHQRLKTAKTMATLYGRDWCYMFEDALLYSGKGTQKITDSLGLNTNDQ